VATQWACIDGNEAAARVAHKLSEVIAIYPITPASTMGELADVWSAQGRANLWGGVPEVIEMQSEAGAAAAMHGALQKGALTTTFTASQGLLLMLPNMFKMAGELLPGVVHVAARAVATHALSIFGDHSDVMAARTTGFALLASASVQEAQDLALVAHGAALRTRVPFLHFFDGFRTSHEVNKIALLDDEDLSALIDEKSILAHRGRRLTPDRPALRGSAQNPDVFFQAREAANPFYDAVPATVQEVMDALGARVGRHYHLIDYTGAPDAERVIALMGSGAGAAREVVDALTERGERVGLIEIRLHRPFPTAALLAALPESAMHVAVLDRTKEPGSVGEPLYQDVVTALAEGAARGRRMPRVIGGRYGLASKEFTPAMVRAVFGALREPEPRQHFTVGIVDDVSGTSLHVDEEPRIASEGVSALFFGLGSDGTVGASRSSTKIIGEQTDLHAQAYFVYDSKKSGAVTVSHLRFGPRPIRSTYLIDRADFIACHHFGFVEKLDVLAKADEGATFLLNSPFGPDEVWDELPREIQQQIIDKKLRFSVIDANRLAREVGMGNRINTVMQPCFFALASVLPRDRAIAAIRSSIEHTYAKRGTAVVRRNLAAVDRALDELREVPVPAKATSKRRLQPLVPPDAPDLVQRVTARLMAGEGDRLPVSALPPDGTFPTGTARYEKRAIARDIPIWDSSICIDCGKCAMVCPHAAIRMKVYPPEALADAPATFPSKEFASRDLPGHRLTIQVAPDDCTGCGVCVDVCPSKSKEEVRHKSINMESAAQHRERERGHFEAFLAIPELDLSAIPVGTVKGAQVREPLFEFSGACAGCGETPYLKLLTQLFGDRIVVANATGCSSIYGGNLPTTPWSSNRDGRGPAWANSLFEDNAEFGLGMLLALERHVDEARRLLADLTPGVSDELAREILEAPQRDDGGVAAQRQRVAELLRQLATLPPEHADAARRLSGLAEDLVRKSIWIIGGDGWAYDIGSGGLDHVLASSRNVNVLVLDTQVYSNTGGQASKATPRAAVAKFAAGGKSVPRKDLGMIASAYGNVYVAQVALGADDRQTLNALLEADAWDGPSLIIAYSTCIAHGIDMSKSMSHQRAAVRSGFWPLFRYHPGLDPHEHPFHLDSRHPSIPLREFTHSEARFAVLDRSDPERARHLMALAQADANERWRFYEQLARVERTVPHEQTEGE
jgi:pyruvate-ferredoxin/flavodoxin oxidoreductase